MSSQVFVPLCAAFAGYLLGSISFAVIVARRYGVDILKAGSGNPGATNVKRVCGKRPGNLVFALDVLKGAVAAGGPWVLALVLSQVLADGTMGSGVNGNVAWWADDGIVRNAQLSGFLGAVLGHCFSIFLKFKGGKGVAVSAGGLLGAIPLSLGVGALVWLIVYFLTRYVSVASLVAGLTLPVTGYLRWGPEDPRFWLGLAIAVFFIFTHRGNIVRLLRGEEHRFGKQSSATDGKKVCKGKSTFFSKLMRRGGFFSVLVLVLSVSTGGLRAAHTCVSLLAEHSVVEAGQGTYLALRLHSEPGWHTYAKDPGEAGLPTSIEWKTVAPATTGEWLWPSSHEFVQAGIKANVLEGDSVILIPLTIGGDAKIGENVKLAGIISWLECDDKNCVPGETEFSLILPIGKKAIVATENTALFEQARRVIGGVSAVTLPIVPEQSSQPPLSSPSQNTGIAFTEWTSERQQALLDAGRLVYVDFTAAWCVTCLANKHVYSSSAVVAAFRQNNVALLRADWTKKNSAIAAELARYQRGAIPFNVFLRKGRAPVTLPEVLTSGAVLNALEHALSDADVAPVDAATSSPFPVRLLFGFLGGFLLNLMPCVFPVLGLKLMHFAGQAGNERRKIVAHSLVFTAGVVLSFWALAAVLLVLRAGGRTLGWGFQLQEPRFVFVLAVLLFTFGLNMAGVFEIGLRVTGTGEKLRARPGLPGAFFSGVLATVAATPCAAPFLGVALGAALAMPSGHALAMFTSIAFGLSSPCLLFAVAPGLLRLLPRPGAWMETLKQGLSFLLFASVAYLLWVLAAQVGNGYGLLQILLGLVLVSASCWVYGRWTLPHLTPGIRRIGLFVAVLLFGGSCAWGVVVLS